MKNLNVLVLACLVINVYCTVHLTGKVEPYKCKAQADFERSSLKCRTQILKVEP